MIGKLSDRLLGLLVPRATARAGCAGEFKQTRCAGHQACPGRERQQYRWCEYNGDCTVFCGSWTWGACGC
ncbi:hypothetical protein [Longispora albida]|uniref:hypothetical protein n=1 Tax=Longispora albida TaxID=203523 RepID=UPI00037E7D3B|nr:hypothetical protein [Longispora albida]